MVMNQAGVRILGGDVFQELVEIISGVAQPATKILDGRVLRPSFHSASKSESVVASTDQDCPLGARLGPDALPFDLMPFH
jgi:hypothetical protein